MNLDSLAVELLDGETWYSVPVSNLAIAEDSESPVREFGFTVKLTSRPAVPAHLLTNQRRVRVEMIVDGDSYLIGGRIMEKPRRLIAGDADEYMIKCYDETHEATRYRFVDSWPKPGLTTWHEIVIDAWEQYGPSVTFDGVEVHPGEVSEIACPLDTLFEFMQEVCARTGWAWRLEDGDLQFYDPAGRVSDLTLDGLTFRPGTVIDEGMPELANVCLVPARFRVVDFEDRQKTVAEQLQYFMQYAPLTRQFEAEGQIVYLDQPPKVFLDAVELENVVPEDSFEAETADAVYNAENRFIRLRDNPGNGAVLLAVYTAEIPVLVRREHAGSVALFGEIQHVIRRSPRPSRQQAEAIADAYLADHALPVAAVRLDLLTAAVRAGTYYRVIITEHGIDQLMPCTAIERRWSPADGVSVVGQFQRAPVADSDLILDLFRRLNRLEARETAKAERVERYLDVQDTWRWRDEIEFGFSNVNRPADSHQLTHLSRYIVQGGRQIYPA